VNKCLSIKGAEDAINKPHAFEISTTDQNMYFIADSDKVRYRTARARPACIAASQGLLSRASAVGSPAAAADSCPHACLLLCRRRRTGSMLWGGPLCGIPRA
jgi:hypothetical protein